MKKALFIILALTLVLSVALIGCNNATSPDNGSGEGGSNEGGSNEGGSNEGGSNEGGSGEGDSNEGGSNEGGSGEGENEGTGPDENEPAVMPSDIILAYSGITLAVSDVITLPGSVKVDGEVRDLTYSVKGSGVTLSGNVLTANAVTDNVTVTASADKFTSSFTVTVVDDGAFGIENITLIEGEEKDVALICVGAGHPSISYEFSGNGISIVGNTVKGLVAGTTTTVIARTERASTAFKVTVLSKDVADFTVTAPENIYTNYPAKDIVISFANENYASKVIYTWDNTKLKIEDGKLYATGAMSAAETVTVTAKTEFCTKTFTVKVSQYNGSTNNVETKVKYYENNIIKPENKGGIIFLGDSYFDGYNAYPSGTPAFWKEFYTKDFQGQKAFLMGMSATTIAELEISSERTVYPMEPKEIVIHVGFNDVHSTDISTYELSSRIIALVEKFNERLPGVKIYYFGIEPKKNALTPNSDGTISKFYYSSMVKAKEVNATLESYSKDRDWFTFIDTSMEMMNPNGTINSSFYLSTDLSHLTAASYSHYTAMLNAARGVNPLYSVNNSAAESGTDITKSGWYVMKDGSVVNHDAYNANKANALTANFVVSGRIDIKKLAGNSHAQLRFGGKRFLLWDSNKDGVIGIGYTDGGTVNEVNNTKPYTWRVEDKLSLRWTVIVNGTNAYLYINDVLVKQFSSVTAEYFNLGALAMDADFHNISVVTKENNATEYAEILSSKGIS